MNKKAFTLAPSPHPLRAYLSPNIKVVQFAIERGFADSPNGDDGEDEDLVGRKSTEWRSISNKPDSYF